MVIRARKGFAAVLALVGAWPTVVAARCDDVVPPAAAPVAKKRMVAADDILRLRDIGQPDGSMYNQPSPLAVSPDGRSLAFVINRADPETNTYCRALAIVALGGPWAPRVIDRGGEIINYPLMGRGMTIDAGFPQVITPAWSPDGRWIAYLRRDNGRTQVWRARADGGGAQMVTHLDNDAEAVAWSGETSRIVFAANPGMPGEREALEREGRQGWLYDARFSPMIGSRPMPAVLPRTIFSIAPDGSDMRPAEGSERLIPLSPRSGGSVLAMAQSGDGRSVSTRNRAGAGILTLEVVVAERDGRETVCRHEACSGRVTGAWWMPGSRDVVFLRREGWAKGEMGLYRWTPGSARPPVRVLQTRDVLLGCVMAPEGLVCTRENATRPRYVALVDPRTGSGRPIFDPNPEFASIELGKVERLTWKNDRGIEGRGDLVLPPGYQPGKPLATVIVTYRSNGFLRGGTGDEYPIHPLAAKGFAVLSLENLASVEGERPGLSDKQLFKEGQKDWAERRSQLSSQETAARLLIARGIADPARIGISGLSNGASSVRFALINSTMFAAASASTCCVDEQGVTTYAGIAVANDFTSTGYPAPGEDPGDFWKPYSFVENAARMDKPLLLQVSDEEMLLALPTMTALQAARKPVEMIVFPNEHHMKWQPIHRAAIYERNIDWFAFWLQGRVDPDPAKREQYRRWTLMRDGPIPSPYVRPPGETKVPG
ncbi:Atxe2 family lasso peptide isopeptidase [Novosphingobium resinovorum]|uniref:Peptidase S9 prolyl oligopeptidase catalytic domain-containing protein n=1 Tax=Novosphingobium resinovorum TaxID=158500 RepID=A0A1D8A2Q0_9SPHN|nr:Atxe2 family lasso peptide isopeptidase [Novosphingobium resinovorum]AOR76398.1 hypothetical protein BES08_06260 [Novosphingobium resinovorum]